MQRGCNAIISAIQANAVEFDCPARACLQLADAIAGSVGGTSGALYRIFFTAAGRAFSGDSGELASVQHYANALTAGADALGKHGGAGIGDRSMMDALIPAAKAAQDSVAGVHMCTADVIDGRSNDPAISSQTSQTRRQTTLRPILLVARPGRQKTQVPIVREAVARGGALNTTCCRRCCSSGGGGSKGCQRRQGQDKGHGGARGALELRAR